MVALMLIGLIRRARSRVMINWYRAQVTGDVPSPLYKHTSTLVGTKVYLFGTIDVQVAQQQLVLPVDAQRLVGLAKDRESISKEDVSGELDKIYVFDTGTRYAVVSTALTWQKRWFGPRSVPQELFRPHALHTRRPRLAIRFDAALPTRSLFRRSTCLAVELGVYFTTIYSS